MEKRNKFTGVNSIRFNRYFQSDSDCYRYLSELKWNSDNPYRCKKCGHSKFGKGKKPYSRRCAKCNYDESPTAGTMFDKLKFPLLTAFHIIFRISTKKKGMSSLELSQEFELRQKTCWAFKRKIHLVMASSKQFPMTGEVHVDEFSIGQYEVGVIGRNSRTKKKLVVVGLEILAGNGVGRAYAQVINKAAAEEFRPFFYNHISRDAKVVTDVWTGYKRLVKEYPALKQIHSNKGANFKEMNIHIMNIKNWLRGIHHHCTKEHLQGYLDEYHYRYNRRNNMETIFDLTIKRMVMNEPKGRNNN